jgi:hypothetical protein
MHTLSHITNKQSSPDLQTVVMPCRMPCNKNDEFYTAAYKTWSEVWRETLLELDGSDVLYSDHFTRQDYMVAIFNGDTCVALTCFRRADLSLLTDQEDSWFKPWPHDLRQVLGKEYKNGVVISWVTIHKDYRKTSPIVELRELNIIDRLAEMMNLFLEDCGTDAGFGVTRNNRSVNRFGQYAGSNTILSGAELHGVEVDLITLKAANVKAAQSKFPALAFDLWSNRLVFTDKLLAITEPIRKQTLKVA